MSCEVCQAGLYQDGTDSTECVACAQGKYANMVQAATECIDCVDNSSSPAQSFAIAHCVCDPGFHFYRYSDQVKHICIACSKGHYNSEPNSTCVQCEANTYSDTVASAQCSTCPVYSAASSGSIHRDNCTCIPGAFAGETGDCQACSIGKYKS